MKIDTNPKIIAFYLPQFHPIPENDSWWGEGFTEWTNVTKAEKIFEEHYQPHFPTSMGYYDLRLSETREKQAALAKQYGIFGFCYHHYWFNGKRLLERPFNDVLSSEKPDFPFCVCWANENWTRRWDGLENEVLIAQNHSEEDDKNFILDLIPAFLDKRYIRVNNKPLLIVYRVSLLPNPQRTAQIWRETVKEYGIDDLHLVIAQSFGITDPAPYGFDAAVEFPPHGIPADNITNNIPQKAKGFSGNIYDYNSLTENSMARKSTPYTLYKTIVPSWDNTARKPSNGSIYHGASPKAFEQWLRVTIANSIMDKKNTENLVFINAWNEWAEGCHLEPDKRFGFQYLESVLRCVTNFKRWSDLRHKIAKVMPADYSQELKAVDDLFATQEKTIDYLLREINSRERNIPRKSYTTLCKQKAREILNKFPILKKIIRKLLVR